MELRIREVDEGGAGLTGTRASEAKGPFPGGKRVGSWGKKKRNGWNYSKREEGWELGEESKSKKKSESGREKQKGKSCNFLFHCSFS